MALTAHALENLGHHLVPAELELPSDSVTALLSKIAAAHASESMLDVRSVHDLQRFSRELVARSDSEFNVLLTPTMTIESPEAGSVLAAAPRRAGPTDVRGPADGQVDLNLQRHRPARHFLPLDRTASGLPIWVPLVGGPWDETVLFRLAAQLEQAPPCAGRRPSLWL